VFVAVYAFINYKTYPLEEILSSLFSSSAVHYRFYAFVDPVAGPVTLQDLVP
jgi:hypothetical protein